MTQTTNCSEAEAAQLRTMQNRGAQRYVSRQKIKKAQTANGQGHH